ncbi:MAG: hypothetical protein MUF49_20685 [Oculatellaceae cyanobacterium Prado106]|nr:hypothetical protein [Oculatellaceae cyanobacterium Prado106]
MLDPAYLSNDGRYQAEVDVYLAQQRQQAEKVREENLRWFPAVGVCDRLLSRQAQNL